MDRQILNITANEQILTCDNPIKISTNKVNYIEAHFTLGDNWSGYDSIRAVWFNDFYCISTVLDSNGVAFVPSEVMKRNGKVKVNLVGSISENDVLTDRLTSYPVVAVIVDCTAQINGAETAPITPSQFEQYVSIVRSLVDSVKDIDHIELNSDYTLTIYYSDGTSDTTGSVRGADGNGIESVTKTGTSGLVDTYTITFTDGQTTTFNVTNGAKGDTGNGIASIEKTSTVGLVDTYTITYTNGTTTTFTVTNGEKGDKGDTGEVSLSELEQATVVQTLSDNTPYNYRRTNNGNGSGTREYDEIVGASVGWNQLVPNTNKTSQTSNGITFTVNADGSVTLNGTATADAQFNYGTVNVLKGHKYAVVGIPSGASSTGHKVVVLGTMFADAIRSISADDYWTSRIIVTNGTTVTNVRYNPLCIDLTLAFGSTIADYVYSLERSTAGSGVTWLKTHFPKLFDNGYQPFDAGSIKSVSGLTAHEMVGKNVWDEEWDVGALDVATGANCTDPDCIRSENYIRVMPSATYYVFKDASLNFGNIRICRYDANKNFIDSPTSLANATIAMTENTHYVRFYVRKTSGTATYSGGICINLSDTSINGQYFPYESHTYPLDSSVTLRGQYKLDANNQLYAVGDVWKSDGEITRKYGTRAYQSGDESDATVVTDGTTTVYPLTTPTTETSTPYTSPQWCDSHGTEEYIGSELPVGHNTDYPMSLSDTVPTASGNYTLKCTVTDGVPTFTWQSV